MSLAKEQLDRLIEVLLDAADFAKGEAAGSRLAADAYGDDEETSGELHAAAVKADDLAGRLEGEAELLRRYGL